MANKKRKSRKKSEEDVERGPAFYWWFLANVLALCFAVISWAVCLHVFRNPEIPRNYEILKNLGRLPELKRYTVLGVPNGSVLAPDELYGKYFGLGEEKMVRLNSLLIRNYMRNFEKTLLLNYVEGDYRVTDVRKLEESDFIYPGFVLRAQAMIRPDDFTEPVGFPVVIEYIFPTANQVAASRFQIGDTMEINKNPNCAAVMNVSKVILNEEPALQLTVIPIAYGPYRVGKEQAFAIEPPAELNPSAGLPVGE